MKATGIIRPLDNLGRIVLPIELRKVLGINSGDHLEIFVEDENIILKKHEVSCIFCGSANNMKSFKGKNVCQNCITELEI